MRKEYDFSDSVRNPYAKHLKKQVSLNEELLHEEILTGLYIACGPDPAEELQATEIHEKINTAIAGLSQKHKEVFVLYALKEYSYKEIAEMIGDSIGTVMSRLYYARKYLQEALRDYLE